MKRIIVGIAVLIHLSSQLPSPADEAGARLAGQWTVKFANGVVEWCAIGRDRDASVVEARRKSTGKTEAGDGCLLIFYEDSRVERWTAVGRRAVVEHWFPSSAYPRERPVIGIAEAVAGVEPEGSPRADPGGQELKGLMTTKSFAVTLRQQFSNETAGELRRFIDPRYLKEHGLENGPFPIRTLVTGDLHDNSPVDPETILVVVETAESEKEIWLFRMTEYQGRVYLLPPAPPDPETRSFTPWTFRRKL